MHNRSRTLLLVIVAVLAASLWPAQVFAQQAVTLASLQISIWPEFDKPSSLVILDGVLAPSVALPAQVTVHMPAAAQAPNAVAVTGTDGSLLQAAYTTAAAGGDIIVTFTSTSAAFRVEYYDPALVINGDKRSYSLRWKTDFAIGQVALRVQEPYGSASLTGEPVLVSAGMGDFGLSYDTASLGAVPAGGTVSLDLSYTKSGSALSATAVGPQNGASVLASTAAPTTGSRSGSLPWLAGAAVLGLFFVGGGAAWYVRNGSVGRAKPRGRRTAQGARLTRAAGRPPREPAQAASATQIDGVPGATKQAAATTVKDAQPAGFCTQCGNRHQPEDRFCRQCGTPVRA